MRFILKFIFLFKILEMKKLIAVAFIGGLLMTACSKKETESESNTMLAEPDTTIDMDSPTQAYGDGSPLAADSVAIKPVAPLADSAQTK